MIRFIHLADVHLGAVPDRDCPWSSKREAEIQETFRRVIAYIRKNPVDLLFIAGDLFHRQPLLRDLKEANYLFSTIPDTKVFLIAGNHDCINRDSFYRDFEWESNVVFFEEETIQCREVPECNTFVYGLSYHHREIEKPLYDDAEPLGKAGFHVLLAHGGDAKHIPIDASRLASSGFDYIALGHIHKPHALIKKKALYSGALEPIDRGDFGKHGFIEGTFDGENVHCRFVPAACRAYEELTLRVSEESTQYAVEEELRREIGRRGKQNLYRIILDGMRSPDTVLFSERLKSLGNIFDIVDQTKPAYDLKELYSHYRGTLVGDYIRYFSGRNLSEIEEKALYHGLSALLETTVRLGGGRKL